MKIYLIYLFKLILTLTFREDQFDIDSTALISSSANLNGKIKIGAGTIIHPNATIIALHPIEIGDFNIIEEQVIIKNDRF